MTHVVQTSKLTPVITAAQRLLDSIQTGEMFSDADKDKAAVTAAADHLQQAVDVAVREIAISVSDASPFLRYRETILRRRELQDLVAFLFGGDRLSFFHLFGSVTDEEKTIAICCIAHYSEHGENDDHFMRLAAEIFDLRKAAA